MGFTRLLAWVHLSYIHIIFYMQVSTLHAYNTVMVWPVCSKEIIQRCDIWAVMYKYGMQCIVCMRCVYQQYTDM